MAEILITGANRGIGLAMTRQFRERGDGVVAVCRQASDELKALDGVRVEAGVDVTRREDIGDLDRRLGDARLDVLVMNAGTLGEESFGQIDADDEAAILEQFRVNAMGPLLVVQGLVGRLGRGGKVALITSRMGSIADNGSGGYYGYRMSKAALNAAGRSLALDLQARGIAVVLLHPGFVRTRMTGERGDITPEEAARRLVARIDELELASTGTFRHSDGSSLPW